MTNYPELKLPKIPKKGYTWSINFRKMSDSTTRGYFYDLWLMKGNSRVESASTVANTVPTASSGAELERIKNDLTSMANDILYTVFPETFDIPFVGEYDPS